MDSGLVNTPLFGGVHVSHKTVFSPDWMDEFSHRLGMIKPKMEFTEKFNPYRVQVHANSAKYIEFSPSNMSARSFFETLRSQIVNRL